MTGSTHPSGPPGEAGGRARETFHGAQAGGHDLGCLLVAVDRLDRIRDEALKGLMRAAVAALVVHDPEGSDRMVSRTGDRLLVLCPGLSANETGQTARRLIDEARKVRVVHAGRAHRLTVSVGVAHNQKRPKLDFETLIAVAIESLGVAQGAGGNRWVHTELYDLLQRHEAAVADDLVEVPAGASDVLVPRPAPKFADPGTIAPRSAKLRQALALDGITSPIPADHDDRERILLLERRIRKLVHALDLAEAEIDRLRSLHGADPGIGSIYRTVQGLSPEEAQLELKRKLMRDLFEANLALQKIAH